MLSRFRKSSRVYLSRFDSLLLKTQSVGLLCAGLARKCGPGGDHGRQRFHQRNEATLENISFGDDGSVCQASRRPRHTNGAVWLGRRTQKPPRWPQNPISGGALFAQSRRACARGIECGWQDSEGAEQRAWCERGNDRGVGVVGRRRIRIREGVFSQRRSGWKQIRVICAR